MTQSRLEETEANASKTTKKLTQKLEQRIVEMESSLDAEHRRFDEAQKAARKQERRVAELLSQLEEEQRMKAQQQDNVDQLQQKLKTFKRQVEEAVSELWEHITDRSYFRPLILVFLSFCLINITALDLSYLYVSL